MKGGTIRRIAGMFGALSGLMARGPVTKNYPDPKTTDPRDRRKKRTRRGVGFGRKADARPMIRRGNLGPPTKCEPGTVTYRDWLVRELGYDRRLADGYLFAFHNGYTIKMPMPGDLG